MRRKTIDDQLSDFQRAEAAKAAIHFTRLAPGHGHRSCKVKDCGGVSTKHIREPYEAAGRFILERDR